MSVSSPKRKRRPVIITIAILVLVICIVSVSLYAKKTETEKIAQTENRAQSQIDAEALKAQLLSENDSDGDGLQDWQEVLWDTDPYNPDTNADGIPDGEEIKENLDPRIVGPNGPVALQGTNSDSGSSDAATSDGTGSTDGSGNPGTGENQSLTETDLIAQDIFSKYLALSNQDGSIDPDTMNTLVTNLIQSPSFQPQYTKYSAADLKIEPATGNGADEAKTIRAYGNALEEIVERYSPPEPKSELEIVYESMANNNQDEITDLDPIIAGYTSIINAELALPVPQSAVSVHLAFINAMTEVLYNIQGMRKLFTDPAPALSGVVNYENSGTDLQNTLSALESYFVQQGVIFTPEETGYPLTQSQ